MLSAGVHGGKRSGFLRLLLNVLLVVEESSKMIPRARGAGQCFRECRGTRASLAVQTGAEVRVGIGRVRQMRN